MGGPDGVSSRTRQPGRRSSRRRSGCRPGLSPRYRNRLDVPFEVRRRFGERDPDAVGYGAGDSDSGACPEQAPPGYSTHFFHRILNSNLLCRYDGITTNLCIYTGRRVNRTHGGGRREVYADERRRGAVLATPGSSPSAPQEAQESRAVHYAPALSETEIGRTLFIRPSPHLWWGEGCRTGGDAPYRAVGAPGSCRPSGHRFVESRPRAAEYRKFLTSYRPFHSPTILGSAYRGEPSVMSLFLASEATCIRTLRETGGRWCHRECHQ